MTRLDLTVRKKIVSFTLLVAVAFVCLALPFIQTGSIQFDPHLALLDQNNSTLSERILSLSENLTVASEIARYCNNNNVTNLTDQQILFLRKLSVQNEGIPYSINNLAEMALPYIGKYEVFQDFNQQEADVFVRAICGNFNSTMIEKYYKAIRHAVRLGANSFYNYSPNIPRDAIGVMVNRKLDKIEEDSLVRLLKDYFIWDARGELVVPLSTPEVYYENPDLYYKSLFDTWTWFELNSTRGSVQSSENPDKRVYLEYSPVYYHGRWESGLNSTLFLEKVFISNIRDFEERHVITKRLLTDQAFFNITLERAIRDPRFITGIYPAIPTLVKEYANFIANNGMEPDKAYLAIQSLFFDNIQSKRLVDGMCYGFTLARIHWGKTIGVPTFYFQTRMENVEGGRWKDIHHAEPGFLASTSLMSEFHSKHPDRLAHKGSIICPFFLTKSYLEDNRVFAPYLKVRVNGKDYYLYGDRTVEVYRKND